MADSNRFARYEENFLNSSRIISRCLMQLDSANGNVGMSTDSVISATVEIEGELSEAEGYLRAMDVEFRVISSAEKRSAQQKVSDYKDEFRQLNQNFQDSKFKAEALALKQGSTARSKLLTANQRIDESTASLEQSRMLIAQTEGIGNKIITDLESQKETLTDAKEKVQETKEFTVDANRILKMMGNRAIMHKVAVMLTILVLFAAICAILYYGFIGKNN